MPAAYHVLAASFVTFCVWLAMRRPEAYAAAMQEDRAIEWLTVFVFAAAGVIVLRRAIVARRAFDGLVGLFLLFVAGEEMSWGQRLLGLTPPSYFLEHNTQQEMNLHNFADVFGSPKDPFVYVLAGYAVLLPVAARVRRLPPLLQRMGATPPPLATIPWFLLAMALLSWYPFRFTGEWTELLAGSAFLAAAGATARALSVLAPSSLAFAFSMQALSARGGGDAGFAACASREIAALQRALAPELSAGGNAHRRVWTFVDLGRLDRDIVASALASVSCPGESSQRRTFAVDPWGTAYWVRVRRQDSASAVTVYSFGPNRRRDEGGDDIIFPPGPTP